MPLQLNGYSAHIRCDDKEVPMYDIKKEGETTITCWIPSEVGKKFSVHWGDASAATIMNVCTYVDGRLVDSMAHEADHEDSCEGMYESATRIRPFIFAPLATTDDENIASPMQESADTLCTIRITMTRVERYVCSDRAFGVVEVHDIGPVHEKCKKAGVHTVSFGEAVEEESNNVNEVDFIGVEKEPFATFIFRYRPLNMLQANGIAPLPPKAAKKRSSDQLDTKSSRGGKKCRTEPEVKHEPKVEDDEDEEAEDLAFLEEQLAMMQRRVEEKRAARRAKTVMKREPSPIHVPSSFTDEVIDLTSD